MSNWAALIIGMLQGFTEFFPVSSSAHIKLAKMLLGIDINNHFVLFDLACHLGTLVASLIFFRKDIIALFTSERRRLLIFFIALFPLVPFYFILKPVREWAGQPQFLGYCLIITALILFIGHHVRLKRKENPSARWDALWIGAMQGMALIPGISRSASTIASARMLGWSPSDAVRFSFLLAIPTIMGGNILEALRLSLSSKPEISSGAMSACTIGFVASFGIGFFMIRAALRFLEKGNLKPFAWYCLLLGCVLTLFLGKLYG